MISISLKKKNVTRSITLTIWQEVPNLTLYFEMSQNGQTQFKNLAAFAARFLKCVGPIYDIAK